MLLLYLSRIGNAVVDRLADLFPQSAHVYHLEMAEAEDSDVWDYAQENGFTIVTRDSDYNDLTQIRGFPPKIAWIRRGNCNTNEIEAILRRHFADIQAVTADPEIGILTLY